MAVTDWLTASQHHSISMVSNMSVMVITTGKTKWTVRGAATRTGPAALSQRGRGARPLAAQHPCHSQLCTSPPKRRPGHGGAAYWLSGEIDISDLPKMDGMQLIVLLISADFFTFSSTDNLEFLLLPRHDMKVCMPLFYHEGAIKSLKWSVWLLHCSRNSAFPWIHSLGNILLFLF